MREKVKELWKILSQIRILLYRIRKKAAKGNSRSRFYEIFLLVIMGKIVTQETPR